MRVKKKEGSDERRIVTAMVVDETVLSRVCFRWEDNLFRSRWANIVADWCVKFYDNYSEPPREEIQGLFESWAADWNGDDETVELVESFLSSLSEDYEALSESTNSDYISDLAGEYFNKVKLQRLSDSISGDLDIGDGSKAKERVVNYSFMDLGCGSGVDILSDKQAVKEAMTKKDENIIEYPGALGAFFNDVLVRDGLVAMQAPEKRGKTFWLMDMAWRAMEQKRKVAFFGVGDMSQKQMMRRLVTRAAKRPIKPVKIKYPRGIEREPQDKIAEPDMLEKTFKKPMTWKKAWKKMEELRDAQDAFGQSLFKLSTHPNSSISVKGITSIVRQWEREGWVPDVIVIDYADILAMNDAKDERGQINETWKALRTLSQVFHCLVVTATQADAKSYDTDTMSMANFSEDKRKFAHVTGMFGINQTPPEKNKQLYRLNWLVLRESEFDVNKTVHVASCLKIANPAVCSCF